MKKSYSEKLKDPRWQKKRLEIMERDDWQCRYCGEKSSTLHVHHIEYHLNCEPWEYENENYITLCLDCHEFEHSQQKNHKALTFALFGTGIPGTMGSCFLSFLIQKHGVEGFKQYMKSEIASTDLKCIYGDKLRKFVEGL